VTEEEEVEEEDEDGHKEFILFMGLMFNFNDVFSYFVLDFFSFVSLNFIRFLHFCFLSGFLLFALL
jgi:hypothetical protein